MAIEKTKSLSKINLVPSVLVSALAGSEFKAAILSIDDGLATLRVTAADTDSLKGQIFEAAVSGAKVEKGDILTIDAAGQVTEREYVVVATESAKTKAPKASVPVPPASSTTAGRHGSTKMIQNR